MGEAATAEEVQVLRQEMLRLSKEKLKRDADTAEEVETLRQEILKSIGQRLK